MIDYVQEIISSRKVRKINSKSDRNLRDHDMITERVHNNGIKIDFVSEYIDRKFGLHVTTAPLLAFAAEMSNKYCIKLDRLAKRNRDALLCWYSENWDTVFPHLNDIAIYLPKCKIQNFTNSSEIQIESRYLMHNMDVQHFDPSDLTQLLNYH
ncbi:hypothetical protein TVAG_149850 [Trichomonas vaginalis G3]|uniref:Uncharacterized protein n=1 Tax=Trichomonas vaginalis (strain ATCC PRA-98 / G3) TaxID=412133 RepID=A2FIL6_TRIV3|nr:hypothetical protein TVAGG3_0360460 [Trichomonas vaginalis G3]EAX95265.1 hypothetical protein TVAG_149850 [Trichomonas vaginalis G3]KAI5531906.1 hypothetical protein TVAGG3_0360460 [Trichomonas vaginalis G3]|eukprot:XP_001308195.1 hypothetical protein [Trichomonas vaginalis G3]